MPVDAGMSEVVSRTIGLAGLFAAGFWALSKYIDDRK
jgi:hypothetical protein